MEGFAVGQIIDGFRLDEQLESGGMARFFRVSREGSDMLMVMKVPFLRLGEDPITIVGYEVEQMILPKLSGPHVPRFVAGSDFERPYIVMEFIPGRSVKSLLPQTPLLPAEVAAMGAQIAFALHDIHRQHVIHLDLKPSNIILRDDGTAVLIDFGLSRHDQLPDLIQEEAEGPVGTGGYVAPEQVLCDRADPRSDLFALGAILYFLAAGDRPFGEAPRMADWRRRLWRAPVPPRVRNPSVPPWLQEIILRCLEVDPAQRYASAAQLAFDLQHPEQVVLTERADRSGRAGLLTEAWRWFRAGRRLPPRRGTLSRQLASAPIVMAAVDLAPGNEALGQALLTALRRVLVTEPDARLACVNVLRVARLALEEEEDEKGRPPHLGRLIELKHWARGIPIAPERITYQVLAATDPAGALVEYARANRVDHIVIGARAASALRRYLGSVSARVVAEAPCSVTVVRVPAATNTDAEPDAISA